MIISAILFSTVVNGSVLTNTEINYNPPININHHMIFQHQSHSNKWKRWQWYKKEWLIHQPSPVPEPSTWLTLLIGVAFVGFMVDRRKHSLSFRR